MKVLRLLEPVFVFGKNIFGRSAWIKFSPCDEPGWYWQWRKNKNDIVPINREIVAYSPRRITLRHGRRRLEIFEHIAVLRWLGIDGIVIESSSTYPPYFGRGWEFWESLRPLCAKDEKEINWLKINKIVRAAHSKNRYLEIIPNGGHSLEVKIGIDFPLIGSGEYSYCLPAEEKEMEKILKPRTLGWPRKLHYLSKSLKLFGWPHHENIIWPQDYPPQELLHIIALHRLGDMLGTLSLVNNGLIAAKVTSCCAGHKEDVEILKKLSFDF